MQHTVRATVLEQIRDILISAGVGVGIVFLVTVNDEAGFRWQLAAYGALIGAMGFVFCAGLAWLLRGWLEKTRLPNGSRTGRSISPAASSAGCSPTASRWPLDLVHFRMPVKELRSYFPIGVGSEFSRFGGS